MDKIVRLKKKSKNADICGEKVEKREITVLGGGGGDGKKGVKKNIFLKPIYKPAEYSNVALL